MTNERIIPNSEPLIIIGMNNTTGKAVEVELFKKEKPECVERAMIVDNLEVQDYESLMKHLEDHEYEIRFIRHNTIGNYEQQQRHPIYLKDNQLDTIRQLIPSTYLSPHQFLGSMVDIQLDHKWVMCPVTELKTVIDPNTYVELIFTPKSSKSVKDTDDNPMDK